MSILDKKTKKRLNSLNYIMCKILSQSNWRMTHPWIVHTVKAIKRNVSTAVYNNYEVPWLLKAFQTNTSTLTAALKHVSWVSDCFMRHKSKSCGFCCCKHNEQRNVKTGWKSIDSGTPRSTVGLDNEWTHSTVKNWFYSQCFITINILLMFV